MSEATSASREKNRRIILSGAIAAAIVGASVVHLSNINSPKIRPQATIAEHSPDRPHASTSLSALVPSSSSMVSVREQGGDSRGMETVESIIADADLSLSQKAGLLLDETDQLPVEAAIAATEYSLLCLDSETYEPAFEMLVGEGSAIEVRQTIMADLMDRPDPLRLPLLVRLASLTDHPFSEDARVELIAEIGDDYGTNWSGWSDGVANHLEASSGVLGVPFLQRPPTLPLTD